MVGFLLFFAGTLLGSAVILIMGNTRASSRSPIFDENELTIESVSAVIRKDIIYKIKNKSSEEFIVTIDTDGLIKNIEEC